MAEQQKSFADYVKDVMSVLPTVNGNSMLSVTSQTDADKYRANPFYMQDAIRKRNEEEAAKQDKATGDGLFAPKILSGGDGPNLDLLPQTLNFLDKETLEEQGARIKSDMFGLKPIAAYLVAGIPGVAAQQGHTPTSFIDQSIGLFRQAHGDMGGHTPSPATPTVTGAVTSPVTTTALPAVVDLGTLANPTQAALNLGIVGGGATTATVSPSGGNAAGGFVVGGW